MRSNRRTSELSTADLLNYVVLALGLIVIGVVLVLLIRIQRGLLGIVLAALAVGFLAYWTSELRKAVKKEFSIPRAPKWVPEIFDQGDDIIVIGTVPGREENVKAEFRNGILEIQGDQGFHAFVALKKELRIEEIRYVNRVLQVRLIKSLVSAEEH